MAATQVAQAGLGPLLVAAAFWSLEVRHQHQANARLLHHLAQLGACHVDGTTFIQVRQSRDDDGEVVKNDDVHAFSIGQVTDLADEVVWIHGSKVVIEKATASAKDTVKAISDLMLVGCIGVKVDGLVQLDANDPLHGALGALLQGDVPNTESSPQEVVGPLPAHAGLAHA